MNIFLRKRLENRAVLLPRFLFSRNFKYVHIWGIPMTYLMNLLKYSSNFSRINFQVELKLRGFAS